MRSAKLLVPLLLLGAGCSTVLDLAGRAAGHAAGTAADRTGDRVGEAAGDRAGNAAAAPVAARMDAAYSPMMTQFYMTFVFTMAFDGGGYVVNEVPYRPGDWTRWSIPSGSSGRDEKGSVLERAYLFDDADGNSWWKVKWVLDAAKPETSTMILEALFDKKDSKLLRMRAKMPNETEGKELPVTDQTYYRPPQKLTAQSVRGATRGVVAVTVPAGTFQAKHVVFGDGTGSTAEWYLVDGVPGGEVKFVRAPPSGAGGAHAYEMDLVASGKGARTELGTTP